MWESAFGMVTDQQVRRLFRLSNTEKTQEIAASKAGMDVKTARKYLRTRVLPSERKAERHWRTRKDEFSGVWPEALTVFLVYGMNLRRTRRLSANAQDL